MRKEQLADAYTKLAHVNHYMLGIVEAVTSDERDAAEQVLITRQNACAEDSAKWAVLNLALDILELGRKADA